MEPMAIWEKVLLGVLVVLVLLWFRPGLKRALEQSRRAHRQEWKAVLIPIGLVILFVIILLSLV